MSYKFSNGYQIIGDLSGSDDANRDTGIDFEENEIKLVAGGSTRFKISGSNGEITFNEAYKFPTADGNADQILQTNGSGQLSFVDVDGGGGGGSGGKVLQAVNVFYTGSFETNSTTYVVVADEGIDGAGPFQAKITPSSSSSKLFILATLSVGVKHNQYALAKIRVNIAGAGGGNSFPLGGEGIQSSHEDSITFGTLSTDNNGFERNIPYTIHSIIEPNTTSVVRVVFQLKTLNSSFAARVNRSTGNANSKSDSPSVSSITIFELDGS